MTANRTWSEPLVQRLVELRQADDPEQAITAYANELRAEAGEVALPIDVGAIASLKGVKRRQGDYDFAGRIYAEPGGQLVMDLNANDNQRRRRFTCAEAYDVLPSALHHVGWLRRGSDLRNLVKVAVEVGLGAQAALIL